MLWCEVRLAVPLAQVEAVADVLRSVAPAGVSIEEPLDILGPEEGVRLDPRRPASLTCYLLADDGLGARLDQLDARLTAHGLHPTITTKRVNDADWAETWKEHFQVLRIGRRTVIRPSWREFTPAPGDIVIELDPGMAFGTGQHETTRGCLELLEPAVTAGAHVFDIGTGSGILAIAAAKLGAARVLAVDVDEQAVAVARANAARNGVTERVAIAQGSLGPAWPFDAQPAGAADLVVANIHARALIELAAPLTDCVTASGRLILSGIITEREADVLEAFAALRFGRERSIAEGEWRTLLLARAAS